MSNFVSGNMDQTVYHEHGPFETIGAVRIRRDFIGAYQYGERKDEGVSHHYVYINFVGSSGSALFTEYPTMEDAVEEVKRLDWIFDGLYRKDKK